MVVDSILLSRFLFLQIPVTHQQRIALTHQLPSLLFFHSTLHILISGFDSPAHPYKPSIAALARRIPLPHSLTTPSILQLVSIALCRQISDRHVYRAPMSLYPRMGSQWAGLGGGLEALVVEGGVEGRALCCRLLGACLQTLGAS